MGGTMLTTSTRRRSLSYDEEPDRIENAKTNPPRSRRIGNIPKRFVDIKNRKTNPRRLGRSGFTLPATAHLLIVLPMAKVRKAVITAAGRGTRQYPASTAVQKEMFPLVDRDGLTKPVIQIIGEE